MTTPPELTSVALTAALALLACNASSQTDYPNKPIRLVVPFPPGGSTDFLARGISQKVTDAWGQQVVIDNRAGAGGIIGTDIVAKASPNGYTLLMNAVGHAANPSLYSKLPYDTLRDFAAVTLIADVPTILAVRSLFNAGSVPELIALARAKPGYINVAAGGGVGGLSHLAAELFRSVARIEWQNVNYKGGGPAFLDLVGGKVDVMFTTIASSLQYIQAGRVKALAVTSPKRVALAPDLPTVAEAGLPGYEFMAWYGIVAPAGVPQDIILKLHREINDLLRNLEFRDAMMARGAVPTGGSRDQFEQFMRHETKKYAAAIKASGIRAE